MTQNDSRYRLMVAIIRFVIVFIAIMLIGKLTNSSAHGVGSVLWPIAAFVLAILYAGFRWYRGQFM